MSSHLEEDEEDIRIRLEGEMRGRLMADIKNAIEAHGDSDSIGEPSPTFSELVTMGAVLANVYAPTAVQIMATIALKFAYYNRIAIAAGMSRIFVKPSSQQPNDQYKDLSDRLWTALGRSNNPLTAQFNAKGELTSFKIDLLAARIHLRRYLEPERKGTFQFMDLPPELREEVYKYALSGPPIWKKADEANAGLLVVGLDHDDDASTVAGIKRAMAYKTPPLQEVLALLSVSKQVHIEAVPIFYRINELSIQGPPSDCLGLAMPRPRHLGKMYIVFSTLGNARAVDRAFKHFLAAENLRIVKVDFSGKTWDAGKDKGAPLPRPINAATVHRIKGMEALCMLLASSQTSELIKAPESVRQYIESRVQELKAANKEKHAAIEAREAAAKEKKATAMAKKVVAMKAAMKKTASKKRKASISDDSDSEFDPDAPAPWAKRRKQPARKSKS